MFENDNIFGTGETEPIDDGQFKESGEEDTVGTEETAPEGQADETNVETETQENTVEQQQSQLILGKFKSQDDLAKAYQNLQSQYTKLTQQQKAAPKQEQPNEADEEARLMAWYEDAVQKDPVRANMYLAQYYADKQVEAYKKDMESKLNPIFEERQTQSFIDTAKSKFPDFYEYKDKVGEEIDSMSLNEPELLSDPRVYEIAYMRAKVKTLEEKSKTAFENGKKATQVKEQSKKQIVNETSKASKEEDTLPPGVTLMPEGDGIFF